MKRHIIILSVATVLSNAADGQALIRDSLFGTNGIATYALPVGSLQYTEILELPNNYILHGGYDYDITQNDFNIDMVKTDYCGAVDSSFGVNGLVRHKFSQRNTALDFYLTQTYIYTCGVQAPSNAGSQHVPYVARFLLNGQPDTTFGLAGSMEQRFDPVSSGSFFTVNELGDGRVLCIGTSSGNINGGAGGLGVMRFDADGALDPTFSGDGIERYLVNAVGAIGTGFIKPNGDIIAAGIYADAGWVYRFMTVCWDSSGTLNPNYGTGGVFQDIVMDPTNDLSAVLQPNGFLVLAASRSSFGTELHLIRLNDTGNPDPLFGTNGSTTIVHPNMQLCKGIELLPSGKYMVYGQSNIGPGTGFCMLLNDDGSVDTTFGTQGFMTADCNNFLGTHYVRGKVILPNGQWVFGSNGTGFHASRFATESEVPHISQNFNYLETTGTGTYQWYLNGTAIPGATNDTLHFNQNGSYTVLLTGDYDCTYLSDPFVVSNTGLITINTDIFSLYPNPAKDYMKVVLKSPGQGRLKVVSAEGKIVKTILIDTGEQEYDLDLQELRSGIYIVKLEQESATGIIRFVKR